MPLMVPADELRARRDRERQAAVEQIDEAEAEIVRLGERVQAGERVGEAQERDRPRKEEEHAAADAEHREDVNDLRHRCFLSA